MEIIIRNGITTDLDAVVATFRACWLTSYRDLLPEDVRDAMTLDAAHALWISALGPHPERETLVAVVEHSVVGVARIGQDIQDPLRGHLFSLYVHPDLAGRGIGKSLLKNAIERLHVKGFSEITLWVFKSNSSALGLYEKEGFAVTGIERIDERWKIPEIQMLQTSKG